MFSKRISGTTLRYAPVELNGRRSPALRRTDVWHRPVLSAAGNPTGQYVLEELVRYEDLNDTSIFNFYARKAFQAAIAPLKLLANLTPPPVRWFTSK